MPRWTKVAVLACLICASGWGDVDGSETTSARAESYVGSSSSSRSCFWVSGERKWCLGGPDLMCPWDEETTIGRYAETPRNYYVHNHKDEILGYVRPAGPGRWRAMLNTYRGWARGGTIVRAGRGRYLVFSGSRRLGIARGRDAIAVGAYRLVKGDCVRI